MFSRERMRGALPIVAGMFVAGVALAAAGCGAVGVVDGGGGPQDPASGDAPHLPPLGPPSPDTASLEQADGVRIGSFLGGASRRYYGRGPVPERLEVIWRARIGSGQTSGPGGSVTWSGTGWTGQPTLVRDGGRDYLLIGGYDHGLHKIDASTGETVWRYGFDDVIKGTNTVFAVPETVESQERYVVVGGSRRGFPLPMGDARISPVRAVGFDSGAEMWRMGVPRTRVYSQDADSSPLWMNGRLYVAVESGYVYAVDPFTTVASGQGWEAPAILETSPLLYTEEDARRQGGNLVLESSPVFLGGRIYIAAGSGHVYGLDPADLSVVWDFPTRSDLDGTVVATGDGRLLVAVERQYVPGRGGVFKLDPAKDPAESVEWWFPTENRAFAGWEGGVIGSCAVNDSYDIAWDKPALAAFNAIDGNMYVVAHEAVDGTAVGPDASTVYPTPVLVFKDSIGGAISTPLIVDDHIITAGYGNSVRVYAIRYASPEDDAGDTGVLVTARDGRQVIVSVEEVARFSAGGSFESTPIVWDGRIYIGSRDGYLYCLGDSGQQP